MHRSHLILLLLICEVVASAQPLVTNDGLALTVNPGLVLTIEGSFVNQTNGASLGTINNGGTITLTGDWSNNSANTVFSTDAGTVEFIGSSAAQTIGGTDPTGFYNFIANNSFASTPQIILGMDGVVKDSLTMLDGKILLGDFYWTLGTAPGSPGTLIHSGTTASDWMIGGYFTRYFNTSTVADGSLAGLFPVGSANDFRPIYVSCPTTAPSTGGTITLAHNNAITVSNVSFADDILVTRQHDSHWTVSTASVVGGTYNLRAEGTGFGSIGDVADLRLTLPAAVVGTPGVNAGTTSNPQVNRNGITLAQLSNTFHIGSVNKPNSPLPIELLFFDAKLNEDKVLLHWETASELNNDYFLIEKTMDGVLYQPVGKVAGAGNSIQPKTYSLIDHAPNFGVSYYRLKQVDFNGDFSSSDLVAVNYVGHATITIFPNPSSGHLLILCELPEAVVEITNVAGALVYSGQLSRSSNAINIANQAPGLYFARILSGNMSYSEKLILVAE